MAELDPAIYVQCNRRVDARIKPGHDESAGVFRYHF